MKQRRPTSASGGEHRSITSGFASSRYTRRLHPWMRHAVPAPAVHAALAPVDEYVAAAPTVYAAHALVVEYIAPAPAVYAVPQPVEKYIVPAPAVYAAPAPVEYIASAPAGDRGASASGGVFTRANSDPSANASGGVYCAVSRASVPSLSGCIGHVFA